MRTTCPRRITALLSTIGTICVLSCGSAPTDTSKRIVEDRARGCAYHVPVRWFAVDGEIRSPGGTLLEIHVYELEGAEHTFVEGLPDTLMPKLDKWARHYFLIEGPPTRTDAIVGGEPGWLVSYGIRVRPRDPVSKLDYWVTRHGTRLFILRAAYSPKTRETDEAGAAVIVASFRFLEASPTAAEPAPVSAPS